LAVHPELEKLGLFYLGREIAPESAPILYDSRDLTTHAVIAGMTGSGKTGLGLALLEEAAIDGIPVIAIDPKGDVGNLLLSFPELRPEDFAPWVSADAARAAGMGPADFAAAEAARWREGLAAWDQSGDRIRRMRQMTELAIYTPGSSAGRRLSMLGSLTAPSGLDEEGRTERAAAAASSLLGLAGIEADPVSSREHILLAMLLQHVWASGGPVDLGAIVRAVQTPPFRQAGVLDIDTFFPPKDRTAFALRLNNLIASPSFAQWAEGEPLSAASLLYTASGAPRVSVISIAHLSEAERMFAVSMLLADVVSWVRAQPGTSSLRAILYFDEVFGYLPPVAEPSSKRPLLTLLKQARAAGLGVVVATQNPVDLDYKALSNAGTWFLGRLQTERDKARLLDGLESAGGAGGVSRTSIDAALSGLGKRRFILHNVHAPAPVTFESRWALSYLRGPLTREDIKRLTPEQAPDSALETPAGSGQPGSTLPPEPARAVANASSQRSDGNRSVMTGETSRPEPSIDVMRYQVSNI
jgi:hypothetical protein